MSEILSVSAHVEIMPAYAPSESEDPLLLLCDGAPPFVLDPFVESVTISNALHGFGQFSIRLVPQDIGHGRSLADVIRPNSLVSIWMKHGDQRGVFLGILDTPARSESYAGGPPVRMSTLSGRALASVLQDHAWWYHHWLTASSGATQVPADMREYFATPPEDIAIQEQARRGTGFFALNPALMLPAERRPVALADLIFRFFVNGVDGEDPYVKVRFGAGENAEPLGNYLFFNANKAQAAYFDPSAMVPLSFLPTTSMPEASCWSVMQSFLQPQFCELFSDTYEMPGGGVLYQEVIARKPPWLGHIKNQPGKGLVVAYSSKKPPGIGGMLFDEGFGGWDHRLNTHIIQTSDVVSRNLSRGVRPQSGLGPMGQVANLFWFMPGNFPGAGGSADDSDFGKLIPPIIDESPHSPSYVYRYGIRPMKAQLECIPYLLDDSTQVHEVNDFQRQCIAYSALAWEWFHRYPDMWQGHLQIKGRPSIRVGQVVFDVNDSREYYVTNVTHSATLGSDPRCVSTIGVARGNDLLQWENLADPVTQPAALTTEEQAEAIRLRLRGRA